MKTKYSNIALVATFLLSPALSFAEKPSEERRGGGHNNPPVEAFEACVNQADSDACEVVTPRGNTIQFTRIICKSYRKQIGTDIIARCCPTESSSRL